jgi:hypothetical protein
MLAEDGEDVAAVLERAARARVRLWGAMIDLAS